MLNLDTHIAIDLLAGKLSQTEQDLLANESVFCVSGIVLWEIAKLVSLKRVVLNMESKEFLAFLAAVHVVPITHEIALMSTRMDFKSDPADELIAATSRVLNIPLVTRDQRIRKSKLIAFA